MLSFCSDADFVSKLTSLVVEPTSPAGDPVLEPELGLIEIEGTADVGRNRRGAEVAVLGQGSWVSCSSCSRSPLVGSPGIGP
jgi:hypothetical protein